MIVGSRIKKLLILSLTQPFIIACSDYNLFSDSNTTITFPLLAECESQVPHIFAQLNSNGLTDFQYEIIEFTYNPGLINIYSGYVKMTSNTYDRDLLIGIANNLNISCYPNSSYTLSLHDKGFLNSFLYAHEVDRRKGITRKYGIIDNDNFSLFYFDNPRERRGANGDFE